MYESSGVWPAGDGEMGAEEAEFGVAVAVGAGDEEEDEGSLLAVVVVVVAVVVEGGNQCSRRWPM